MVVGALRFIWDARNGELERSLVWRGEMLDG